jgi:decaprenylphospho-beta-D-erythro-pentofuranosid-2-ulose 2-reductase
VINGLGAVQDVLVVGGSSEIAAAILVELNKKGRLRRVVLAGRSSDPTAGGSLRTELASVDVQALSLDLTSTGSIAAAVNSTWGDGFDVVVLAAGVLPDQATAEQDPQVAVGAALVNYVGQLEAGTAAMAQFRRQGRGVLVTISTVAVERPRADNFVYGSGKAGLDYWATGLADTVDGKAIRVLVVRPGMVRTRMSRHLPEAPMTCDAEDVAKAVAKHLVRGPSTVWVPGKLRWVMAVLRHLPRPIFRRLSSSRSTPSGNEAAPR